MLKVHISSGRIQCFSKVFFGIICPPRILSQILHQNANKNDLTVLIYAEHYSFQSLCVFSQDIHSKNSRARQRRSVRNKKHSVFHRVEHRLSFLLHPLFNQHQPPARLLHSQLAQRDETVSVGGGTDEVGGLRSVRLDMSV